LLDGAEVTLDRSFPEGDTFCRFRIAMQETGDRGQGTDHSMEDRKSQHPTPNT
jgi:hypothetical protein